MFSKTATNIFSGRIQVNMLRFKKCLYHMEYLVRLLFISTALQAPLPAELALGECGSGVNSRESTLGILLIQPFPTIFPTATVLANRSPCFAVLLIFSLSNETLAACMHAAEDIGLQ